MLTWLDLELELDKHLTLPIFSRNSPVTGLQAKMPPINLAGPFLSRRVSLTLVALTGIRSRLAFRLFSIV